MLNNGPYLLGIDYGTESCRVAIFDLAGRPLTFAATPYKTTHPRPGWAEQDPEEWWKALQASCHRAIATETVLQGSCPQLPHWVTISQGGQRHAQVTRWNDFQLAAQTTRGAAIIRDRNNGRNIGRLAKACGQKGLIKSMAAAKADHV